LLGWDLFNKLENTKGNGIPSNDTNRKRVYNQSIKIYEYKEN